MVPADGFKTCDVIMHQRMAARPFVRYENFDTAQFIDYGKLKYDKQEDYRDQDGKVTGNSMDGPTIGNPKDSWPPR